MDPFQWFAAIGSAVFTGGAAWATTKAGIDQNRKDIADTNKRLAELENDTAHQLQALNHRADSIYTLLVQMARTRDHQ